MRDINAKIAAFKGWKYEKPWIRNEYNAGCWRQYLGKEQIGFLGGDDAPDFKGDARLYMALFEEMPHPILRRFDGFWLCIPESRKSMIIESVEIEADTIGTAICLAYMRLHGLE